MTAQPARTPVDRTQASLMLSVVDGTRQPIPNDREFLVRVFDGRQAKVHQGSHQGPHVFFRLPFTDGPANGHGITVSAKGFSDAGFFPVRLDPARLAAVSVMLLPRRGGFSFGPALWSTLGDTRKELIKLLSSGAESEAAGRDRYEMLIEQRTLSAVCLWNILTASRQLLLPGGSVADHIRQLFWDTSMAQDRVFAFADGRLVGLVAEAATHGIFEQQNGSLAKRFHRGATSSFKQTQFNEANLQITFHEGTTMKIDGVDCVKVELDLDYFKDLASHGVLEVLPNAIQKAVKGELHGRTNPRDIYKMRWMAAKNSIGVPDFDPPFTFA